MVAAALDEVHRKTSVLFAWCGSDDSSPWVESGARDAGARQELSEATPYPPLSLHKLPLASGS